MTEHRDDYQWPRASGCLLARDLEDYAEWLFPKLKLEWQSQWVQRRRLVDDGTGGSSYERYRARRDAVEGGQEERRPYEFRKSSGWLSIQRDLRPFAVYVLAARELQPQAGRHRYMPPRTRGMALVSDLRAFHDHLLFLLKKKKEAMG